MTVIPLWRHLSYRPRQARLRLMPKSSPKILENFSRSFGVVKSPDFNCQSCKSPASLSASSHLDCTFVCPVTSQRLPDCSCIHSSLKLHDFCVFCPAVKLSDSGS